MKAVDIITEIRRLAAENPDYIYRDEIRTNSTTRYIFCDYVEEDADGKLVGSCIVGQALVNLGVDPEALWGVGGTAGRLIFDRLNVSIEDSSSRSWITWMQRSQDLGKPWGEAVTSADRLGEPV